MTLHCQVLHFREKYQETRSNRFIEGFPKGNVSIVVLIGCSFQLEKDSDIIVIATMKPVTTTNVQNSLANLLDEDKYCKP